MSWFKSPNEFPDFGEVKSLQEQIKTLQEQNKNLTKDKTCIKSPQIRTKTRMVYFGSTSNYSTRFETNDSA